MDIKIKADLDPLFERAEKEGLWFQSKYDDDLWFSPRQLREAQECGRFRWGAVNWELRPPAERLASALRRVEAARMEFARIEEEIAKEKALAVRGAGGVAG